MTKRYLVTAALPYANGPVHVGHAIGAYLPADLYTRYLRLKGEDVIYICGTDEHGTPITVTADQEGVSPKDVVKKYHDVQEKAFKKLGVAFDNFSGTDRKVHYDLSQKFFLKILENGFIHDEVVERPFCPKCNRFLPDRYVKGVCPHCSSPDQRGDQCEACGKQLEPHELSKPYCSICRTTPEMRETKHWFFELSKFGERIKKWVNGQEKHKLSENLPSNAKNFAVGWVNEGLQDRAITRDITWGIPVPLPEAEGKVLYVWFEAPIGYISSTIEWAENKAKKGGGSKDDWKKYWLDSDTKVVHFIGKDNIPFHVVIWPAILMAEGTYNLPWQIASNEFLNLEGKKMSTSRGWVIWLHDLLNEFDADAVRYYLISIAPETHDSDFVLKEFQEKVNNELIATFGNFVNRTMMFLEKNGGKVPKPSGKADADDEAIASTIKNLPSFVGEEIEKFHFRSAVSRLMSAATAGNQYFQKKEPWKNENSTTLYNCANLVASLAVAVYPMLPDSSERIWRMLNIEGSVSQSRWDDAGSMLIKPGHKIGKVASLYAKIEDDKIRQFEETYLKKSKKKEKVVEKMAEIDYKEFEKMDLRVGVIKTVEDHPNAEKLYLLKVDLGVLGERQVVAGIRGAYSKDELVGKKIVIVTNLQPVKIRGVLSEGMLLAADEGKPILLTPDKEASPGAKIK